MCLCVCALVCRTHTPVCPLCIKVIIETIYKGYVRYIMYTGTPQRAGESIYIRHISTRITQARHQQQQPRYSSNSVGATAFHDVACAALAFAASSLRERPWYTPPTRGRREKRGGGREMKEVRGGTRRRNRPGRVSNRCASGRASEPMSDEAGR